MNTGFLFLIILASTIYVALPYFRRQAIARVGAAGQNSRATALHERRDNLLATIKELEFDHEMGKLSTADFNEMNTRYRREAVELLKRLDSTQGRNKAAHRLEQELRTLRAQRGRGNGVVCASCGAAGGAKDQFCSACGARLNK